MATSQSVIQIAWNEVGYKEQGVNRTKYGKAYGMDGQYWCAIFMWWVFEQAGASKLYCNGQKVAYTPTIYGYYKGEGRLDKKPKVGDLILCKRDDVPHQKVGHVGLVYSVTDKFVYSIDGNSSNKVRTVRRYRTDSHIVGYAHPKYSAEPHHNTSGTVKGAIPTPTLDLSSLASALGAGDTTNKYSQAVDATSFEYKAIAASTTSLGNYEAVEDVTVDPYATLYTVEQDGANKNYYYLASENNSVIDGEIQLDGERKGSPSKLTFKCIKDSSYKLVLGAPVGFLWGEKKMFFGFIFDIKESSDGMYEVTCYDQRRYLKNKHTYIYKKKSATSVLKMISRDFRLNVSSKCADTKYAIPQRIEDNQTLYDILQTALDITLIKTGNLFTLVDDFGSLKLVDLSKSKVDCLICRNTMGKWDSTYSIDKDVYNKARVVVKGKNGKSDKVYIEQNGELMNKWGVLQYTDTADSKTEATKRAKELLKYYKIPRRTLQVDEVLGNPRVRAGVLIPVLLSAAGKNVSNYMLVEKCTHTFKDGEHSMKLTLSGDGFDGQ